MHKEINKKIYIKCGSCEEAYFSGIRLDDQGQPSFDIKNSITKICPSCGHICSGESEIEFKPATVCPEKNDDLGKTYENKEFQLKIYCSDCGKLREISGDCWNCSSPVVIKE